MVVATVGGAGGAPPPGRGEEEYSDSESDSECGSEDDYEDYDEETLRTRIEENPKNHYAAHCLGKLLMEQGDNFEGEKWLRLATKLASDELGYHYELALALCQRNEFQGGLSAILKEIALECEDDEEMSLNHALLGNILKDKGDLKGAIEAYEKAAALDPGFLEYMDTADKLRDQLREADSKGRRLNAN